MIHWTVWPVKQGSDGFFEVDLPPIAVSGSYTGSAIVERNGQTIAASSNPVFFDAFTFPVITGLDASAEPIPGTELPITATIRYEDQLPSDIIELLLFDRQGNRLERVQVSALVISGGDSLDNTFTGRLLVPSQPGTYDLVLTVAGELPGAGYVDIERRKEITVPSETIVLSADATPTNEPTATKPTETAHQFPTPLTQDPSTDGIDDSSRLMASIGGPGIITIIILLAVLTPLLFVVVLKKEKDHRKKLEGEAKEFESRLASAGEKERSLQEQLERVHEAQKLRRRGSELLEQEKREEARTVLESALQATFDVSRDRRIRSAEEFSQTLTVMLDQLYGDSIDEQRGLIYQYLSDDPPNSAFLTGLSQVLLKRWSKEPGLFLDEFYSVVSKPNGTDLLKKLQQQTLVSDTNQAILEKSAQHIKNLADIVVRFNRVMQSTT